MLRGQGLRELTLFNVTLVWRCLGPGGCSHQPIVFEEVDNLIYKGWAGRMILFEIAPLPMSSQASVSARHFNQKSHSFERIPQLSKSVQERLSFSLSKVVSSTEPRLLKTEPIKFWKFKILSKCLNFKHWTNLF